MILVFLFHIRSAKAGKPKTHAVLYCFSVSRNSDHNAEKKKNGTNFLNTSRGIESVPLTSKGSNRLYRRRNWSGVLQHVLPAVVLLHVTVFLLFHSCSSLFL